MTRPTAIMCRAIVAFIVAFWCGIATFVLACHGILDIAILTGSATVLAAFVAGIEFKHAETEYQKYDHTKSDT